MDLDKQIFDCLARVEAHEARCEERDRFIFTRLEKIEKHLEELNNRLLKGAVIVITGMATFIVAVMGPFN
jgi:hypothetical protein|tara:strand:+ start:52 stop:261 length:210 start_codon:yes stop_codon:yes gene_type:complete